jgi:hypothetical protein
MSWIIASAVLGVSMGVILAPSGWLLLRDIRMAADNLQAPWDRVHLRLLVNGPFLLGVEAGSLVSGLLAESRAAAMAYLLGLNGTYAAAIVVFSLALMRQAKRPVGEARPETEGTSEVS